MLIKFVNDETGKIKISIHTNYDGWVWVEDNGPGFFTRTARADFLMLEAAKPLKARRRWLRIGHQ
jgi:hypothetical protein